MFRRRKPTAFCRQRRGGGGSRGVLYAKRSLPFLLLLPLILVFSELSSAESSRTEKSQDIVFLVDTSSSMRDIFDDVKDAIVEFVERVRPGDNVVLITFGEKVRLRFRQKITSGEDIELLERELASLEPNEYFTYVTGALVKGMEELRLLEMKSPENLKTVVLMSDGKNNPPERLERPATFEDILEKYPDLLKSEDSAFFYLSLGEDPDPQVISFMETVEGSSFDVGKRVTSIIGRKKPLGFAQIFVEPVSLDLGTVPGPKAVASVSLAFFPTRGDPSGQVIAASVSARFKENPSWKSVMEIAPAAVNCSDRPWNKVFFITLDSLEEGTIVGTLKLDPLPGHVLFIEPSEIPVTMTISQPHVRVMQRETLKFGPIDSRRRFRQTESVTLTPNAAASDELIQASSDVPLPEGIHMEVRVEKRDETSELMVTVSTDETFRPAHSMSIEGAIHLAGTKRPVAFSTNLVRVEIEVAPPPAGSRAISGALDLLGKLLWPLLFALLAIGLGAAGYWWLRLRPQSELEGKLVLVHLKSRSHDGSRLVAIKLNSVGRALARDSLTIGSSKEAGITLPHKSVAPHHCRVYARVEGGKKRVYIEPVGRNSVIVNLQKLKEPTSLSDRDVLEIGAYTFRFENPHPFKQVVVRYLDGRILKGTPASWDIEGDGFGLLPRDALPGSDEEVYVAFADLKAVYFVRDFDGQIGKKIVSPSSQVRGAHMKITFHDGEELEGYTSANYSATSPRFYFFPADQSGNTISLVVERRRLKRIDPL